MEQRNDDEAVVVCGKVASTHTVIPGSTKVPCTDCGASLWLSPASRALYERFKTVTPLCLTCGEKRFAAEKAETGKYPDIVVTRKTLEEVREYMRQPPTIEAG